MKLKEKLLNKRNILAGCAIVATLVTLTGCGKADINVKVYEKDDEIIANITTDKEQNSIDNEIINDKPNEDQNEKINEAKIKDSSKEIVYAYINDAKEWTNTYENNGVKFELKESYSFKIPQINIDSADADKINQTIRDKYGKIYNEQKEYIDEYNYTPGYYKIEYAYHINGDVLSVIMETYGDSDYRERGAYNINMKTGKEVTNSELLKQKGITEAEFPSKLSNLLTDLLKDMYTPSSEQLYYSDVAELYSRQYKKTTDLSNCSVDNDMYLNVNGHLCVIVTRYNIAGGESTEIIIDMDAKIIYAQH